MASILIDHVSRTFPDGTEAVKDVELEIEDGEFMILVGPSGCGKSTLLRMIVGLEDMTAGDIRIGDDVVTGKPPRDRNLAMVFQNYALSAPHRAREHGLPAQAGQARQGGDRRAREEGGRHPRARRAPRPQ